MQQTLYLLSHTAGLLLFFQITYWIPGTGSDLAPVIPVLLALGKGSKTGREGGVGRSLMCSVLRMRAAGTGHRQSSLVLLGSGGSGLATKFTDEETHYVSKNCEVQ